ncbi:CFEM domain-containing protein [Colletotrichum truncatum]|uniref:CFEM domain-containing protein n=1 Tax=Colletotrichum truncatum TaxID=5467 RepID=A0ACC3YKZ9_COLTU|nr:CFEM domain-containing protein [Colletotrichum truncatum]KAF6782868.1 CFEM domain-containing protein [Colletotrichum truncatum]
MDLPLSELTAALPGCATSCPSQAVNFATCAMTNLTSGCLCKDSSYIETYRLCVRASCDMAHVFMAKNATWIWCDYHYQNETGSMFERVALVIITAFFFFLRQLSKLLKLTVWGADDFTLILGYFCSLAFAVSRFYGYELGIGRDIWSLSHNEVNRFMQVFFAFEILYDVGVGALKASILFFYIRIFSFVKSNFSTTLWCTQAFNLLNCIAFIIANLNQCKPFWYSWEGWDGRHAGTCVNVPAMLISHAAINIAINTWMVLLPVTQVLWLQLKKRQKLEIMSMFGLGIFITIVSCIRLKVLVKFRNFSDPTYDAFYLHMWSYIELSVAVIVACLPSTRQLWRHLVPRLKREATQVSAARTSQLVDPIKSSRDKSDFSRDQSSPTSADGFLSTPSMRPKSTGSQSESKQTDAS